MSCMTPYTMYMYMFVNVAIGCAPVDAPANAHVRSTDNMAVVECNDTHEAWYLTCKGTEWIGSFSNCSKPGSYMGTSMTSS